MNTKMNQKINVGADTCKFQLDIYIRPLDIYCTVTNDEKGISEAVKEIKKHNPERIVIEATGRLEMPFIISNLPEIDYTSSKQASALVIVAPLNRESGQYEGHRKIQGGRHQVRAVLNMAMMSAIQSNPVFKETYQRLVAAGKPIKVAIIACIRKMVVILNSMLRDGVMWETPKVIN